MLAERKFLRMTLTSLYVYLLCYCVLKLKTSSIKVVEKNKLFVDTRKKETIGYCDRVDKEVNSQTSRDKINLL